ncbi:MAG: hypothetical protein M3155_08465, partial [Actinomycetota bacterium]|nr:hypothetical protein [Actinomycetota bacterium]
MTGPTRVEFEVERFEQVPAGSGVALLRVAGRWRGHAGEVARPPTLIVDDGRAARRLAALPGPESNGDPWRAAFSAPAALLSAERLDFALDAGGTIVDLPHPVEQRLPSAAPVRDEADRARNDAEGRATRLDQLGREDAGDAEERAAELDRARAEAEGRAVEAADAVAEARRREQALERVQAEMERRAEDLANHAASQIADAELR